MPQTKRIVVCLSEELLASIDGLAANGGRGGNRSAVVREALRLLIRQRQHLDANLQRLRRGYERMGRINLELAEEAMAEEGGAIESYERKLGGRDAD